MSNEDVKELYASKDPYGDLKRMTELVEIILDHDRRYHDEDKPIISDNEYDGLVRELQGYEKLFPHDIDPRSPTLRVGYRVSDKFANVKHSVPMLSLDNLFEESELRKWIDSVMHSLNTNRTVDGKNFAEMKPKFVVEMKHDGLSLDLRYKRFGSSMRLFQAITRGDGEIGEDVTHNVTKIKNIPIILADMHGYEELDIRGEVVMSFDQFNKVNEKLRAEGVKELVNPRNAAAGSVRQHDPKIAEERGVEFIYYGVGHYVERIVGYHSKTQWGALTDAEVFGFNSEMRYRFTADGIDEIMGFYNFIKEERSNLRYPIDGITIKLNYFSAQQLLGYASRAPRWARAFKYPAEEATTVLEAIDIQVGRTGALTPVARLKPVFVGGVTVTNSTLHNVEEIHRKDLRIGDVVIVRRAGDVVPEIVGPDKEVRTGAEVVFQMPPHCPECGERIDPPVGKVWRCWNGYGCEPQRVGQLIHAASRDALNIKGMGDETIEALYRAKKLGYVYDFFRLTHDDFMELEGFASASANNMINAINEARVTTLARVLISLNIRHVGVSTARDLTKHFSSLEEISKATSEDLKKLEGVGPETASAIYHFFGVFASTLIYMLEKELRIEKPTVVKIPQTLEGQTFVVTGSFDGMTRDDVEKHITDRGGKVTGTVSKKTSFVVAGKEASGNKLQKANDLDVMIINFIPDTVSTF